MWIFCINEVNKMTLLDKNQEKNILDELVITKFETLILLLKTINKNEGITNNSLRKESKISGGKIYHSVKALKSMKLVDNGVGLKINELGRDFLFSYSNDKQKFNNVLKNSCLNVPLFNKIYQENPKEKNPQILFKLFNQELEKRYVGLDEKLIGSAVRRYLMGVHNIKLRAGARLYKKEKKEIKNKQVDKIKNTDEKINSIKELKKSFNLSGAELFAMVDTLPKEKRDEIISHIFSEV